MSYRPDPTFNDSLEPDVSMSARDKTGLTFAAVVSLGFALAVSLLILVRAVFGLPGNLLKKISR